MIVTCHACDTSFQLDESRVPVQGIRVRCSRCKEAFFLEHPSTSQSEAIHEVAEQAAATGSVPPPDSTQDLPPSDVVERSASAPSVTAEGDDEADWEFNHEPNAEATATAEPSATAESFADAAPSGGSGLTLADDPAEDAALPDPEPVAPAAAPAVSDAAVNDESAFGSVDDFSSLMEEDPDHRVDDSIDIEEDTDLLEGLDVSEPAEVAYSGDAGSEELGEPENWDFFSDQSLEGKKAAPVSSGTAIGRVALQPAATLGELPFDASSEEDDDYDQASAAPGKALALAGLVGRVAGWVVTLGLFAIGLVSGLLPMAESIVVSPQVIELPDLRVESIRGSWVETARSGTLLEVTGVLRNRTRKPVALDDGFEVALLTADGSRVDVAPAPAGLVLPEARVRELPKAALWSMQNRAAYELSQTHLGAGAEIPFQAIFAEAPVEAVRFAMEPASEPLARPAPVAAPSQGDALELESEAGAVFPTADDAPASAAAELSAALEDELTWGE